ncbi:ABC transporter substrate-binding protein [Picrophilus oshimae]|uniref:ABC-type transport system, substrate-binding protein n=1 Tax=Picrophilus torridus (strain ATCC 700027 / DSM 9790 / JCM 10055 / NBRC 100828 / KAW 2/3) TaxID=1122961 RepID=A0A8G2FVV7_PICTO|nr:ABC transporter substrate-binding protein [Picrophilus oshimae]SMD30423.1 ABC-type transport system, substrate-binding protein [Picrophilus oshimae DSM 9789]
MSESDYRKKFKKYMLIAAVLIVSLIFVAEGFGAAIPGQTSAPAVAKNAGPAPYTYPTTTMQEPGYTNGTYKIGEIGNINYINIWDASTVCDFMLLDEIYDSATNFLPNESISPWLATSWSESKAPANMTAFSPFTLQNEPVKYIWTVHIRPGVQWQDWTPQNANDTYCFSNHTYYYNPETGQKVYHNYTLFKSMKMKTYYVQAADFILSWEILNESQDYSGEYYDVVNIIPVNNLTVEFLMSGQSSIFVLDTLETPILPYHIWVKHDYASTPGLWNYTPNLPASESYNAWNLGWNPTTGYAPGLVGSGPFMMYAGYGMPHGVWLPSDYWQLYVNPHYFVQYNSSLKQYTPKIYSIKDIYFASYSPAVSAMAKGEIYSIMLPPPPTFLPTLKTIPNTYIYEKPGTGYGYMQINSYKADAPYNITQFRQALNYAVNKQYIASVIDEGYATPGASIVPTSDALYHDSNVPTYPYNPTLAYNMISKIPGFSKDSAGNWLYHGKPVTATIQITVASEDPLGVEGAEVIAKSWDSIGIPTTVKQESFTTLVSNLVGLTPSTPNTFNVISLGISGIVSNPVGFFEDTYDTTGIGTGFYLGPFTSMYYNGSLRNTTYMTNLMNNLVTKMLSTVSVAQSVKIGDTIQFIGANESTLINLGYGVDLIPINNATYTGIVKDTLGIGGFWYWNFFSLHKRVVVPVVKVPKKVEQQLEVSVFNTHRIFLNGQYGNITIQVRNQFGQPVSGANVVIGYNPQGALLNITSYSGTTNSLGQYRFEFKVLPQNDLIYTNDYLSTINVSASATMSNAVSGIGYTDIDVLPYAIAYKTSNLPELINGTGYRMFNITIVNPMTDKPVSGYAYTVQVLNASIMAKAYGNEIVKNVTSIWPYGVIVGLNSTGAPIMSTNLTEISGVTNSTGNITLMLKVNPDFNFKLNGEYSEEYIFIGDYAAGAPLSGEAPYDVLGEVTSSFNPSGFGVVQPFEMPVMVTNQTNHYNIKVNVMNQVTSYNGVSTIMVTVMNGSKPVPGYKVTLTAQNALGANRGYFIGGLGNGFNPNQYFGSTSMPEITLTTNASGVAMANLSTGLYKPVMVNGSVASFEGMSYTSKYIIPFDEFEIGVWGANYVNQTYVWADEFHYNSTLHPLNHPVVNAYIQGSTIYNGVQILPANNTYTMFVNSTYDSMAGPYASDVPFNVSVNIGKVSITSASTGSSGSYSLTYNAPNVSIVTEVTLTITYKNGTDPTTVEHFYLVPSYVVTHTVTKKVTVTQKVTKDVTPVIDYAIMGILAVIAVIFIALFAVERGKKGK